MGTIHPLDQRARHHAAIPGTPQLTTVCGADVEPWLDELAALRIRVFREWPYLYDGDLDYEQRYLVQYAASPRSVFVLAVDRGRVVGASTALPLRDAEPAFRKPFEQLGLAVEPVYYFGESVLLPEYRRQGLGHRFFDVREAAAARFGFPVTAFCAVERSSQHRARPSRPRSLRDFWEGRGYRRRADLQCSFPWLDVGETRASEKTLIFWMRHAP